MHDAPGPVFLILDNLSVHKAPPVKEYVASLDGRLKFLPGTHPSSTPMNGFGKNVKHDDIKRAGIQRGSELFGIAVRALERLQRLPEVIRGFFQIPPWPISESTSQLSLGTRLRLLLGMRHPARS